MAIHCVAVEHGELTKQERKKERKKESLLAKFKAFQTNVGRPKK